MVLEIAAQIVVTLRDVLIERAFSSHAVLAPTPVNNYDTGVDEPYEAIRSKKLMSGNIPAQTESN